MTVEHKFGTTEIPAAPKRVVAVGSDFANAFGFSSPLSLPYASDHGVPQLAEALDGRP